MRAIRSPHYLADFTFGDLDGWAAGHSQIARRLSPPMISPEPMHSG